MSAIGKSGPNWWCRFAKDIEWYSGSKDDLGRRMVLHFLRLGFVALLIVCLSGCGGTKVLKEPEPLAITQSIANASDDALSARLDWIIYRDGPGTWAKNVDWDEYMIGVKNVGGDSNVVIKAKDSRSKQELVGQYCWALVSLQRRARPVSELQQWLAVVRLRERPRWSYWYQCLRLVGSFAESITAR
jgi:hypothetical protein